MTTSPNYYLATSFISLLVSWPKRPAPIVFVLAAFSCGPRVDPSAPDHEHQMVVTAPNVGPAVNPARPTASRPAQEVLFGEMCPSAIDGRPGVMPTFMRRISWDDNTDRLSEVLERNMAKQFTVLGWDGRRVGLFTSVGAATASGTTFAMGGYAGGSACDQADAANRTRAAKTAKTKKSTQACDRVLRSCGLAVAVLRPSGGRTAAPFEEDPEPVSFAPGGACMAGDNLIVDIDRDGSPEAFPTASFLNDFRAPAEEVSAVATTVLSCTPQFAIRGVLAERDPRDWRGLDIIAVFDVDGDGRDELLAVYNYQDRRTWVVYSALASAGRLELVAEGQPWPRPPGKAQSLSASDLDQLERLK